MSTTYRVLSDQLYRSVALVTTSNVVTEAYDTDAYGNTLCYSGPGTDSDWFTDDDVQTHNPINTTIFTGRQYDPESQIYWYRSRYYSPQVGRFISRDSYVDEVGNDAEFTQGPNLYSYCLCSPSRYVDPSGFDCGKSPTIKAVTASNPTLENSDILQNTGNDLTHMASEVAQDAVNAANKFRNVPPVSNIETKYPQLLFTNICPSDHPYLISATSVVSTTIHLNKSGNSALVDIHSTGRWGRLNQSDNPNYEKDLLGTTLSACCECDSSKA